MANRWFNQFNWSFEKNPVVVFADIGQGDTSVATPVADVSQSLAGTFFRIKGFKAVSSGTQYYVWYKVSGTGSDPANVGEIGIEVDLTTNDSAATVTTKTYNALIAATTTNINTDFTITNPTSTTIQFVSLAGGCSNLHDGLSAYATHFTLTNTVYPVLVTAKSMGIRSVTRTGTGLYSVVLGTPAPTSVSDLYNQLLFVGYRAFSTAAPAAPLMFVVSETVSTDGTINLKFTAADGTTATDPACGEEIRLEIYVKNSTGQ